MPLFFKEGRESEPVPSMPGIKRMGQGEILKEVEKLEKLGIKAILLFGSSVKRDSRGSASYDEMSNFHKLIREIKKNSDIFLAADVCLCAYTDHGHCRIIKNSSAEAGPRVGRGETRHFIMDNDETLEVLAETALSYAKAGVDVVAPSAMADGQVQAIREALDEHGFLQTLIMSYSVKYASNFYGPFRDIYNSGPLFGDRRTYQMDPGNKDEALKEVGLDIQQGADIVIVKPALTCLDIISAVRQQVLVPVAAYSVSGEYSMLKAASQKGWLDEASCAMEILNSIKRAGADIIITYWAKEAVEWLKRQE
jgi:porphobilinogen synthase